MPLDMKRFLIIEGIIASKLVNEWIIGLTSFNFKWLVVVLIMTCSTNFKKLILVDVFHDILIFLLFI